LRAYNGFAAIISQDARRGCGGGDLSHLNRRTGWMRKPETAISFMELWRLWKLRGVV
jgi:hypothetical protein